MSTYELNIKILNVVNAYMEKHDLAKSLGGEYVGQSDSAQVDAIELACDLADIYANEREI